MPTYHPAHIDGCSLVVIRRAKGRYRRGFGEVESGVLEYDGEALVLRGADDSTRRVISDAEQDRILPVTNANRIPPCLGFQFFMVVAPD